MFFFLSAGQGLFIFFTFSFSPYINTYSYNNTYLYSHSGSYFIISKSATRQSSTLSPTNSSIPHRQSWCCHFLHHTSTAWYLSSKACFSSKPCCLSKPLQAYTELTYASPSLHKSSPKAELSH